MTEKQMNNFWNKVDKTRYCWNWLGATMGGKLQYGHYGKQYAHRVSWQIHFGEIPKGLCVLHRCDNPLCVNPKHLWLGTHQDNMKDRDKKGRHIPSYGNTKLKSNEVSYIKNNFDKKTAKELANQFKVHLQTIYGIIYGRSWINIK